MATAKYGRGVPADKMTLLREIARELKASGAEVTMTKSIAVHRGVVKIRQLDEPGRGMLVGEMMGDLLQAIDFLERENRGLEVALKIAPRQ